MWQTREVFAAFFGRTWESMQMNLVYDVAHNIAKLEPYEVAGRRRTVCVHRKGAARRFPAGHPEVPDDYRQVGQPVMIPGDMGRASWLLVGQPGSMEQAFGSTCHGAGPRHEPHRRGAKRTRTPHRSRIGRTGRDREVPPVKGLAEEQPAAYKDVSMVVDVVHRAGLAQGRPAASRRRGEGLRAKATPSFFFSHDFPRRRSVSGRSCIRFGHGV